VRFLRSVRLGFGSHLQQAARVLDSDQELCQALLLGVQQGLGLHLHQVQELKIPACFCFGVPSCLSECALLGKTERVKGLVFHLVCLNVRCWVRPRG